MEKTKKVTITLTNSEKEKAKKLSKKRFGRINLSGMIAILINEAKL